MIASSGSSALAVANDGGVPRTTKIDSVMPTLPQHISPDEPAVLMIVYTNYRGETGTRRILPDKQRFGSVEWHRGQQWLLDAWDVEKGELRSFAVAQIHEWSQPAGAQAAAV